MNVTFCGIRDFADVIKHFEIILDYPAWTLNAIFIQEGGEDLTTEEVEDVTTEARG